MTDIQLSDRWIQPENHSLAVEVAFRLVAGESFEDLDVGRHDGRVDLRGFSLPPPEILGTVRLGRVEARILDGPITMRACNWQGLDLGSTYLPSLRFFDSTLEDCVFDRAILHNWRLWGCSIIKSSFDRADLRGSSLGSTEQRTRWDGVSFAGSDLRQVVAQSVDFRNVRFDRAKLSGVDFDGCFLRSCYFAGPLREVLFDGRKLEVRPDGGLLENVDFSAASLQEVNFRGLKLDQVSFPEVQGLRVVHNFPAVARKQIELIGEDNSSDARRVRAILLNELGGLGQDDTDAIFNDKDFESIGGESLARFAETSLNRALEALSA